jgi:hypothetical protein
MGMVSGMIAVEVLAGAGYDFPERRANVHEYKSVDGREASAAVIGNMGQFQN